MRNESELAKTALESKLDSAKSEISFLNEQLQGARAQSEETQKGIEAQVAAKEVEIKQLSE